MWPPSGQIKYNITGFAIVGDFGSHTKFNYTMLGDSVNLAARLEGINKQFGIYTMISEFTRNELGETSAFLEIGRVAVVGRKQAITVFEPLRPESRDARRSIYDAKKFFREITGGMCYLLHD